MDIDQLSTEPTEGVEQPLPPAPPIHSRFLFVDIAALRAKQLRRGATPRLDASQAVESPREAPKKPERVAMEEVKRGLIFFDVPDVKAPQTEGL